MPGDGSRKVVSSCPGEDIPKIDFHFNCILSHNMYMGLPNNSAGLIQCTSLTTPPRATYDILTFLQERILKPVWHYNM